MRRTMTALFVCAPVLGACCFVVSGQDSTTPRTDTAHVQDDGDAAASLVVERMYEAYRGLTTYSNGLMAVVNLPWELQEKLDRGTLMMNTQEVHLDRGEDLDGDFRLATGSTETVVIADDERWLIWSRQFPAGCLELDRGVIESGVALRATLVELGNRTPMRTPFAGLLPLEAVLILDGSLDAVLGAPVRVLAVESAPEFQAYLDRHDGMQLFRQQGSQLAVLEGTRASALVVVDSQTGLLVSATVDIDAADLGIFEEPGVRLWYQLVKGGLARGGEPAKLPWPEPPVEDGTYETVEAFMGALRPMIIKELRMLYFDTFEQMIALHSAALKSLAKDDVTREWHIRSLANSERLLREIQVAED